MKTQTQDHRDKITRHIEEMRSIAERIWIINHDPDTRGDIAEIDKNAQELIFLAQSVRNLALNSIKI